MKRPRPLADLVGHAIGPALAAQGFARFDVLASWPEIVGERIAGRSRPLRIDWPRRRPGPKGDRPEPGALVVRVEGAFALELQHSGPQIVERINAFYGWRCIGRLVLKQGPVGRDRLPVAAPRVPTPDDCERVEAALAGVVEAPLRQALARLGLAATTGPDETNRRRDETPPLPPSS